MSAVGPIQVDKLIQPQFRERTLANATGFIVEHAQQMYLITNFHVVSGRRPESHANVDPSGAWPDCIRIWHHATGPLAQKWVGKVEPLYDSKGIPLWLEHPAHRSKVDVVALPLTDTADIATYTYDPWATPRVLWKWQAR